MYNIEMERDGDTLVIRIDLTKNGGKSGSGKTDIVASTHGNVDIPGMPGAKIGVNAFKYPQR